MRLRISLLHLAGKAQRTHTRRFDRRVLNDQNSAQPLALMSRGE